MPRLRTHPETRAFIAGAVARGKSTRAARRIVKRRLARRVWLTMMHDLAACGRVAAAPRST